MTKSSDMMVSCIFDRSCRWNARKFTNMSLLNFDLYPFIRPCACCPVKWHHHQRACRVQLYCPGSACVLSKHSIGQRCHAASIGISPPLNPVFLLPGPLSFGDLLGLPSLNYPPCFGRNGGPHRVVQTCHSTSPVRKHHAQKIVTAIARLYLTLCAHDRPQCEAINAQLWTQSYITAELWSFMQATRLCVLSTLAVPSGPNR